MRFANLCSGKLDHRKPDSKAAGAEESRKSTWAALGSRSYLESLTV
jgi:hypothetical protein